MRLVPNWHSAWKWLSVQIAVLAAAGQASILAFPWIHDWLSDTATHAIGVILLLSVIVARMIDQQKPTDG